MEDPIQWFNQEAQLSLAQSGDGGRALKGKEMGRVLYELFYYTVFIQLYTNTISKPNTMVAV